MSQITPRSSKSNNPTQPQGFRVFSTAISLALAEVILWIAILMAWYSLRQIAPNVQFERAKGVMRRMGHQLPRSN